MRAQSIQYYLVVEPDDEQFAVIARAFARAISGASPHREVDGAGAKEFLSDTKDLPAAVIADVDLPQLNGFKLLTWVRANSLTRDLPFVLWASSPQSGHILEARRLGATAFCAKPTSAAETTSAITSIVALALRS